METQFDLVVIGAGPGGYVAAIKAAQRGMRVAVVEKSKAGGTCLNRGCIPTKALLHTATLYREMRMAAELGITVEGLSYDNTRLHERKAEIVEKLRNGVEFLLKANKIEQFEGTATIPETGQVSVQTAEGTLQLTAANILVATGSVPSVPPIPGLDLPGVLTSDDLLEGVPPDYKSIAIVGGGVIGVEFATVYNALGCEVTILEAADRLLPGMDREISQNLSMILKKRGIAVHTGAAVQSVAQGGVGLLCAFEAKSKPGTAEAQAVLVATGRKAFFDGLFTGAKPETDRGIKVDSHFRTSMPGIWAIGDVIEGSCQLAHAASAQGTAAVAYMAGAEPEINLNLVPGCVYTNPEIATVGITADEAKAAGIPAAMGKFSMAGLGKSVIENADRGFIKLVSHAETGKILGAQLMCQRATDLVGELATAIANGLTAHQLAEVIRPHPTFVEGVTEAVEDIFGTAAHIAPKRRLG